MKPLAAKRSQPGPNPLPPSGRSAGATVVLADRLFVVSDYLRVGVRILHQQPFSGSGLMLVNVGGHKSDGGELQATVQIMDRQRRGEMYCVKPSEPVRLSQTHGVFYVRAHSV